LIVCLDEVGAIVVDVGSSTFRGGYAGEDMPKVRSHFTHKLLYRPSLCRQVALANVLRPNLAVKVYPQESC